MLARSLDPERVIGSTTTSTPAEPKDAPPTVRSTGPDGVLRFYGNAVIDRGPWLLSVGIPHSVVMARVRALWVRNVALLSLLLAGTLVILIWFGDGLARQLNQLRAASERIAGGDLTPPTRGRASSLEFEQLQDAFITMAANLRDTRDALDRQVEQERKMREMLQSLQRQVVRQERLTAVGLLVSGVAHELNNPLQAILGTLELLERNPAMTPDALDEVTFIKTQSGRAREIIRNLSRFSSQQSGPPTLVDLRDVIEEIVQLRRRNLESAAIALETECAAVRPVLRELHGARAGHSEFRDQRASVDPGLGTRQGPDPDSPARLRQEDPRRSAGRRPGRADAGRGQAVSAVLHDEAGRQRNGARPVGELRHHRFVRRHDRPYRQRVGRRDVLFRAASGVRRRAG